MNNIFKHYHIYKITFHKKDSWLIGLAWNKKKLKDYCKFFVISYNLLNLDSYSITLDLKREIINKRVYYKKDTIKTIEHLTVKDLPLYIDCNHNRLYVLLLKYQNPKEALLKLLKERKVSFAVDLFI